LTAQRREMSQRHDFETRTLPLSSRFGCDDQVTDFGVGADAS
jgi:hypothetical protein